MIAGRFLLGSARLSRCFAFLAVVVVVVMRRVRGYLLRRVVSANARVLKGSLLSVSGLTSILPKMFSRVLMVAGHLSQWETVSSSSSHSGHVGLVFSLL